jgi:hypothetical protein
LVEQGTENPCVGGSIPPLATIFKSGFRFIILFWYHTEPPCVGGYENHPWFSPCGPACGCSNSFQTNLSIPPLATIFKSGFRFYYSFLVTTPNHLVSVATKTLPGFHPAGHPAAVPY